MVGYILLDLPGTAQRFSPSSYLVGNPRSLTRKSEYLPLKTYSSVQGPPSSLTSTNQCIPTCHRAGEELL
jgi:hypothetical protein